MPFDPAALQRVPINSIHGHFFRLVRARYANDPLSMIGSLASGGRYNVRNAFGALYLGFDQTTCQAEVSQGIAAGVPFKKGAFACWQYDVSLEEAVQLTDPAVCMAIGLITADLTVKGDRQWASLIGEPLYHRGIEGLTAPSAHNPNGKCLDVFLDNLKPNSRVVPMGQIGMWP